MNSEVTTTTPPHYKRRNKHDLYPVPHSPSNCKSPFILSVCSDELTVVWTDEQQIGLCVDNHLIGADIRYGHLQNATKVFLQELQSVGDFFKKALRGLGEDADLSDDLIKGLALQQYEQTPLQDLDDQAAFKVLLAHW